MADSLAASPSPVVAPSGSSKRRAFTHSGGTAPDLHRTSLLCPRGHPRQGGILSHPRIGTNVLPFMPTETIEAPVAPPSV